jgi:hypothetical protein
MLCEKCREREAHVHNTYIDGSSGTHERRVQHLCVVCAGIKTEAQLEEERRLRGKQAGIAREKAMEESRLAWRGFSAACLRNGETFGGATSAVFSVGQLIPSGNLPWRWRVPRCLMWTPWNCCLVLPELESIMW